LGKIERENKENKTRTLTRTRSLFAAAMMIGLQTPQSPVLKQTFTN
jgi:hypothetical protein